MPDATENQDFDFETFRRGAEAVVVADDTTADPKDKRIQELEARLTEATSTTKGTEVLAKLMSDPVIRQVIEARQGGREVDVKLKDVLDDELSGIEDMNQAQLAKFLIEKFSQTVDGRLGKKLTELDAVVKSLAGDAQYRTDAEYREKIAAARKRFPDFDDYQKDMVGIFEETLGRLEIPEMYVLAKLRRGKNPLSQAKVETERPSGSEAAARERKTETPDHLGIKGFQAMLAESRARRTTE